VRKKYLIGLITAAPIRANQRKTFSPMSVAVSDFGLSAESIDIRLPIICGRSSGDRRVSRIAESPIPERAGVELNCPASRGASLLMQLAPSHQAAGDVGVLRVPSVNWQRVTVMRMSRGGVALSNSRTGACLQS